jgi:hypothetical protein
MRLRNFLLNAINAFFAPPIAQFLSYMPLLRPSRAPFFAYNLFKRSRF